MVVMYIVHESHSVTLPRKKLICNENLKPRREIGNNYTELHKKHSHFCKTQFFGILYFPGGDV